MGKVNQSNLDRLVEELIALEPELGRDRTGLEGLVRRLLEARPEVRADRQFATELRQRLLDGQAALIEENNVLSFMQKTKYALAGAGGVAALAAVLTLAVLPSLPGRSGSVILPSNQPDGSYSSDIVALGPNAFGQLTDASYGHDTPVAASAAVTEVKGYGGGGGLAVGSSRVLMPAPEYAVTEMKYVGDELTDLNDSAPVYRWIKGLPDGPLVAALAGYDDGLVDLNQSGLGATSVSLRQQDGPDSYWIHLDLQQGMVSISREYGTDYMYSDEGRNISDSELISLADDFLNRYGIDRSSYTAPVIERNLNQMRIMELPGAPSSPTHVSLVYQLQVDGRPVYGFDGRPYGLRVTVNTVLNQVESAVSIISTRFESSDYSLVTDTNRLIAFAERGGAGGPIWLPEDSDRELELGTPTLRYYQHQSYDAERRESRETYVPALFFPVLNLPDGFDYRQQVIVPLVSEVLESYEQANDRPVPEPMPLLRAEESVSSEE